MYYVIKMFSLEEFVPTNKVLCCRASACCTLRREGEGGDAACGAGGPDGSAERRPPEAGRRVERRDQRKTGAHQPAQRVSRFNSMSK